MQPYVRPLRNSGVLAFVALVNLPGPGIGGESPKNASIGPLAGVVVDAQADQPRNDRVFVRRVLLALVSSA